MEQTKDIFGKRLFELRESRGESQQELADSMGITRQSLSRYELGERTANIDLLKKIAEHYDVSADYLLGLTGNTTTDTNLQAVCKYTGLSEKAINNLADYTKSALSTKKLIAFDFETDTDALDDTNYYLIDVMNALFESHFLRDIIPPLVDYLESYIKNAKESSIRASDFAKWNINQWFIRSLDNFVAFVYDNEKENYKFAKDGDFNAKHNPPKE